MRLSSFCLNVFTVLIYKIDNSNYYCFKHDAAFCPVVYPFTMLIVSWQFLAQILIGCHGIAVSPEDPPLGTFHRNTIPCFGNDQK